MIYSQDMPAMSTSGSISCVSGNQPTAYPASPRFLFAGTSYTFDAMEWRRYRSFMAFDTSIIPARAEIIACLLTLTCSADEGLSLLFSPFAWAAPLSTASQTKWETAMSTQGKTPFTRGGPDIYNRRIFSLDLHKLGYNRKALGSRLAFALVLNDESFDESVDGDERGISIADMDSSDPAIRPKLSVVYRTPGVLVPRGKEFKKSKLSNLEKGPKISLNIKDSQLQ